MRKINIFNRNTNLPSYRRMPVSRGIAENRHTAEARCPGIAIAMTCPAGDFSSQGDEKHNVCDASFCIRKNWIPAFAGMTIIVIAALFATPSFAEPSELDKKTVASKAYVDTKQDIIQTGNVLFYDGGGNDSDVYLPGLVAYDSTTQSLKGNKIGILDYETILNDEGSLTFYSEDGGGYGAEMDDFVPTARAVAEALQQLSKVIDPLTWDSAETTSTNAYDITFGGDAHPTANAWPRDDKFKLVNTAALAQGLALKQNKIPAGTAGNVVTYTGNAGVVGSVAVSSTENYDQQNQLTNGSNLANVQLVSTKQNKMTCAGWDSETHTDEHCWLWSIE